MWKKCRLILLWAALPSLHTRPSSFFGLAVAGGAAAAAVSPVGQPRKAKRASSSHMGNLPWQAVFPHGSWHRCCGLGTCPWPSILSLLGTPWLLPSSAQSLALPEPGISHCNHHKTSPSLEKFPGEGHFHVCTYFPHSTYFLDRSNKKSSTLLVLVPWKERQVIFTDREGICFL